MKLFNFLRKDSPVVEDIKEEVGPAEDFVKANDIQEFFSQFASHISTTAINTYNKMWVYACCRAIVDEVSKLQFVLKNRAGDIVDRHPMLSLLKKPGGNFNSQAELISAIAWHMNLFGQSFTYLPSGQSGRISKVEIMPLQVDRVRIELDNFDQISHYEYTSQTGYQSVILPEDMAHPKFIDPSDFSQGKSPVQALEEILVSDSKAIERHIAGLASGNIPGGILDVKNMTKDNFEKFKEVWNRLYSGNNTAGKLAFSQGGDFNFTKIANDLKDLSLLDLRTFNRDAIMAGYRVGGAVLGIQETANRASAEAINFIFASTVTDYQMKTITEALANKLMPKYRDLDDYTLEHVSPIPNDKEFELKKNTTSINTTHKLNEVRADIGLDEVEGGDKILVNSQLAPLEDVATPLPTEDIDNPDNNDNTDEEDQ